MNNIGISLGWNCYSAVWASQNGIRERKINGYKTCPFDKMISNYKGIVDCLNDDFKYFCDVTMIELIKEVKENEYTIYNNKYNFGFNHESPGHSDLYISEGWSEGINHFIDNDFNNFKKRYNQRIENFRGYLSDPNNFITFVITSWKKTEDDMDDLKSAIEKHYPNLKYKIIVLDDPNGENYYLKHMRDMKFTDEDYEVKRLL